MRVRFLPSLLLLALSFAAAPVSAACQVVTVEEYPDVNYTTLCVLDRGGFGDGTQTFGHEYVAHVGHAVEVDPVFDYAYAEVARGTWTYDDGEVNHSREWTHVGAGAFEGVRGLAGGGAQANVDQRDQTAPEDGSGACSGIVGRSTCVGASGWLTVQDVASVGAGVYYQQSGEGAGCQESYEVDMDAVVVFVPVTTGPMACSTQMPWLHDSEAWDELPWLP